jgi:(E)-4-hydroxy-3-methylbut-2-enyl-diphosphate synthase
VAGDVKIGAGEPVVVQTMTKVDPHQPELIARQADELLELGCGLVRLAIPDKRAAEAIAEVRKRSKATIVADIHFDPRLALAVMEAGAQKIRVNPGNLRGGDEAVEAIATVAKAKRIPIRVGANSGSLPQDLAGEEKGVALSEAVLREVRAFERVGFTDLVVSAKGSDCVSTVAAGRSLARETDYPIHVGVTAAGPEAIAWAKSAIGIGSLLVDGIGDTIRVSYTGHPSIEVRAAYDLLDAVGQGRPGPEVISCPTCGRTRVDLVKAVEGVRLALRHVEAPIKVAVMGCEVNGPGEARDADVGIACAKGGGYIFAKGERMRRVEEDEIIDALVEEVKRIAADGSGT